MAVNLHKKYSDKIQEEYKVSSLTMSHLSSDYDFTGAKTVMVFTPITVDYNNYDRTAAANRYGTPAEMQDTMQELTVSQDKGFSLIIDKGNNLDQGGMKNAAKMLRLQISERGVPMVDKHVLTVLGEGAGTIVSSTASSNSTIATNIATGTAVLDNAEVPDTDRTLFVSADQYKNLRLSTEFLSVEVLGKKALSKGEVGEFDNMKVIKVPSKRLPTGCEFIIVHKASATAPHKIHDSKLHIDPPGISGNLLEGRDYFDCFIFGTKIDGVYSKFNSSTRAKSATPTVVSSAGATQGKLTSTDVGVATAVSFYWTDDGTDPRYSPTRTKSNDPTGVTVGKTVKAIAYADTSLRSDILTFTAPGY